MIEKSLNDNNTTTNNSNQIETKLDALGLKIPERLKVPPNVKTPSTWVRVRGDKAYISGHGPQNPDGSIAGPFGKVVGVGQEVGGGGGGGGGRVEEQVSVEQAYESAKLAGLSILGSLKRELGRLDRVTAWLQVRGMVNTVQGFTQTADVINGFSDLILTLYGPEVGIHARSAIGVQALPLGLPVIIEGLIEIDIDS
jgi:enamine deaminase RidA (YjgF/YER057c/UK114 family)